MIWFRGRKNCQRISENRRIKRSRESGFSLTRYLLWCVYFGSILKIIQPTGFYPYTEIEWGRNDYFDYYHVYCEGQTVYALGYSGIRNIALFVEGPMLTYTLSFALYYELFFREQGARKLYLIVMVATIITSFSTTGLLIVIALLYLRFYRVLKNNKFFKYLLQPISKGQTTRLSLKPFLVHT